VFQILGAVLLAGILAPAGQSGRAAPVVVSAAISLTDALREIERAYAADGGGPVRFNFAGSNVLARQIVNGAPADLFISADLAQMDYAARAGAIDPATRVPLLGNRLAVVVPSGTAAAVARPGDLAQSRIRRIAIGDPAAVPAGRYARAYLERSGLWTALQPKLLPLANVRAALAATESGGADAAIVYESDAAASTKVTLAFIVPEAEAPLITYPAAIVAQSGNRAGAERFLAYLRGPRAREIFERYRFRPHAGDAR
jgi:molybdate transport system substrate-binding protein